METRSGAAVVVAAGRSFVQSVESGRNFSRITSSLFVVSSVTSYDDATTTTSFAQLFTHNSIVYTRKHIDKSPDLAVVVVAVNVAELYGFS